ncbi:MAG: hydantoinase/oxoprolinase family protein [Actinomycetota bacterium]
MAVPEGARVGVDVGGTFTDVAVVHGGTVTTWKLATTEDQSEGFERGVREALDRAGSPPPGLIAHGTTVATNAVLERRGARTALITTEGFRDLLRIGRQNRPSLYDLRTRRPEPLVPRALTIGVAERIGPGGEIIRPLDEDGARRALAALIGEGVDSVAVCLLFSFANAVHERRIRELVASVEPEVRVCLSTDVLPEFREYERASTTVLCAYVGPAIKRYMSRLSERVADLDAPVIVMRSGGGTMTAAQAADQAVHTLVSGPAAGVRGAAGAAAESGFTDLVTFDMGGTSTDVCLVERGEPAIESGSSIGGLPFRTPALAVHTVGAGGGSILWIDSGGALRAGPRSAGAIPGPACYGKGGTEPTVTDAHLVLGHLDPAAFLGGRARLERDPAVEALGSVARTFGVSVGEVALAGLAAVRAGMSKAIRVVTVERGRDPRELTLVAFGGAGPMHATAVASELEIPAVLVPPAPGVLSALGLLVTPLTADASRSRPMADPDPGAVAEVLAELEEAAVSELRAQGAEAASLSRSIDCRYPGQAHEIPVAFDGLESLPRRFHEAHRARFGWSSPGEAVELVTFRVRVSAPEPGLALPRMPGGVGARPLTRREIRTDAGVVTVPVYARAALGAGDVVKGPAIVTGEDSTVLIDEAWRAEVDAVGSLVIAR